LEQKELAEKMGISPQLLSMTLAGERATKARIEQLVALGIPEKVHPALRDKKKTGPKTASHGK
jgi:transcriptional regulator with XRE-family HTH domain